MKLVKFALYLAILIALTKNGYSADPASETLTEPSKNADEDFPGSLDVKPAPLRVIAEAFLTKRRRVGERMSYVVRSLHSCEKEAQYVAYQANNVNKVYRKAVCNSYSKLCSGPRHLGSECKPVYKYITDLNKSVLSACECKAD